MKVVDKEAAYARRNEGMRRAEDGVDEAWYRAALAFVTKYCRTHELMFCDDLWREGLEIPREARALGPVILQAVRTGVIERSGRYRPSVGSNMTPKPVWRSLVYEGKPEQWFYVKHKDGQYASGPYKKKSGRWGVYWVRSRAKATRWAQRSEAFEVRKDLRACRVVSAHVYRFTVRPAPVPTEVERDEKQLALMAGRPDEGATEAEPAKVEKRARKPEASGKKKEASGKKKGAEPKKRRSPRSLAERVKIAKANIAKREQKRRLAEVVRKAKERLAAVVQRASRRAEVEAARRARAGRRS